MVGTECHIFKQFETDEHGDLIGVFAFLVRFFLGGSFFF